MEEDIRDSATAFSKKLEKVQARLKEAVEIAEERAAYESAHDEELLKALGIVEAFIKRKKRVCYGGTAMNAILPSAKRFYDPEMDLPDYDFYTPDLDGDVEALVKDLQEAGFKEVYHRVGIHEGTKKILVNFVAVADISAIEPELFAVFLKRAIVKGGVPYTDPDILRMMMYLEISRPKGQVARWEKVFERLQLVNQTFPVKVGKGGGGGAGRCKEGGAAIPEDVQHAILNFIVTNQRVLCNGALISTFVQGIRYGDAIYEIRRGGALLFTSSQAKEDALQLRRLLKGMGEVRLFVHRARGEIVPERYEVRVNGRIACLIVTEVACHAFVNVPLEDGRVVHVGSLEFLITLYLSLHIFTKHSRDILGQNAMCLVAKWVDLAMENYLSEKSQFPPFSLNCHGHQTGYASLIRLKVLRIKREKEAGAGAGDGEMAESMAGRSRRRSGRSRSTTGTKKKR